MNAANQPGGSRIVSLPLLENGLDFLASAAEHLAGEPSDRDLKYAILHLAAGIELLLKERLRRFGPEYVLVDPAEFSQADYERGDFRSVYLDEALRRLRRDFSVSISNRQAREVRRLRNKRNRLQHFGITDDVDVILAVTARGLDFALDFVRDELDGPELDEEAAEELHTIRAGLGRLDAFVRTRWESIGHRVSDAPGHVLACPSCGEDAAVIDDGFACEFCGRATAGGDVAAGEYAYDVLGVTEYETVKDGGDWVISDCPSCTFMTLVDVGPSGDVHPGVRWVCFTCADAWTEDQLAACDKCTRMIPSGRGELGVCGDCFAHTVDSN